MTMTSCEVCQKQTAAPIISIPSYPAYLLPLPPALAVEVVCPKLELSCCEFCGHMQVSNPDPEVQRLIYEVYYSHYTVDANEALVPHYRVPFETFIDGLVARKVLPCGKTLEVGCSTGERSAFFAKHSEEYVGVDPSERIKMAEKKHPEFRYIQGYFPKAVLNEAFDVVISQFNLEHITNVGEFIESAHSISGKNGVLILQVPDIGDYRRTSQPNFLGHEHIQYFTRNSLHNLLTLHGFEPIGWGSDGPSLIVAAKRVEHYSKVLAAPDHEAVANAHAQARLFNSRPQLPQGSVVYYGVGPLLFWLLSDKSHDSKFHVIDDNATYHGQGLPSFKTLVQKPSAALFQSTPTVVLSLNKIYHERVLGKLRAFNVPMTVHYIGSQAGGDQGWTSIEL